MDSMVYEVVHFVIGSGGKGSQSQMTVVIYGWTEIGDEGGRALWGFFGREREANVEGMIDRQHAVKVVMSDGRDTRQHQQQPSRERSKQAGKRGAECE